MNINKKILCKNQIFDSFFLGNLFLFLTALISTITNNFANNKFYRNIT